MFYGWLVVLACNVVAMISWGTTVFVPSILAAYYTKHFGWPLWQLSFGPLIFHVWAGIIGVAVGRLVDRRGPCLLLIIGAVSISSALLMFGVVNQFWQYIAASVVLATGFACLHTITIGKIVARWFLKHRTRAMTVATLGAALGGVVLVPLSAQAIEHAGLLAACILLATITLVGIVPLAIWTLSRSPDKMGLQPDGGVSVAATPNVLERSHAQTWTVGEVARTWPFWGMSICFGLAMTAQSAFFFHHFPFLQSRYGLIGAANVVTLIAAASLLGRMTLILLADRMTPASWALTTFALQLTAFAILGLSPAYIVVGSVLFGLTMGVAVVLQPLVAADCFGRMSFGTVFGPIYLSARFGSAAGPLLVGGLIGSDGDYGPAWLSLAALLAVVVILFPLTIWRPLRTKG